MQQGNKTQLVMCMVYNNVIRLASVVPVGVALVWTCDGKIVAHPVQTLIDSVETAVRVQ